MKVVTRKEAVRNGAARYYTGKPCANGHLSERYISNHNCLRCGINSVLRFRKNHPEYRSRHKRSTPPYKYPPTRPIPATCECCGAPPGKKALCLDHDHCTEEFRGWLCNKCNLGIGLLGDNISGLETAILYLKKVTSNG